MSLLFFNEKDLRTRINEAISTYNIKQIDIAKETGVHHSTLSIWLQGKGKPLNNRLEENVEKWLLNLQSKKPKTNKITNRLHFLKAKRERSTFNNVNTNHGFGNLIPINLYIDLESKKFKDQFLWDINEPYISVDFFAKLLVDENQLPSTFEDEIKSQMIKQINQFNTFERLEGEIIRPIKLEVRQGDKLLTDQFEWDINNPDNNTERFAANYAKDLGIGNEFILPIALSIKEQVLEFRKTCYMDKKFYYQMNNNTNKSSAYYSERVINSKRIFRDLYDFTEWQPNIKTISLNEIQKHEQKEERKYRYAQRKR